MKKMFFLLMALVLLFSGCSFQKNQVQDKKEVQTPKPNVRAFQVPFTRDFLTSTKEVLPGYYPFRSKTGGYEIAFPAGGVIGERSYELRKKSIELLMTTEHVGNYDPIKEVSASLTIDYFSYYANEIIEAKLSSLRAEYDNKLDLRKLSLKDRDIYWSTYEENKYKYYGVAGYVQNTVDTGGIYFSYEFTCEFGADKCQSLGEAFNQKRALDWVKEIRFK